MRLLVVHPRMSVMGGGERVAIHSIKEALREGHEVYLATEQFAVETFEDFFDVEGLFKNVGMLTYPPFRPLIHKAVLYQRLIYNQIQLRKILSNNSDFDLILNTAEIANQPAIKCPSAEYCYFPEYFGHLDSAPASTAWKLYYAPAKAFYHSRANKVNRLLAVSDYTRGFVKRIWGRESTTLYPPCPVEAYSRFQPQKDDLVITIGRMAPEKRMEDFIRVARSVPDVKFAIIGSVVPDRISYYQHLKATAPDNLSIIASPLRKATDILAKAKIYLHCALNEHFGIAIVEAMAAGCVPVVHNSGGPREIVSDNVGYKWNSIDEAVAEISTLINDDELRRNFVDASTSRAQRFKPENFESGMRDVFASFGVGKGKA